MDATTEQPTGTTPCPRRGDWILTRCGHHFYPLDPRPAEVSLEDIAYALAHQCRWTGHTRHHYSIAQHACYVAEAVESIMPSLALAALHHDSAEAYIGDIARPWKRMLRVIGEPKRWPDGSVKAGTLETVNAAESGIIAVIFDALGITHPSRCDWQVISTIDNRVLRTEHMALLPADDAESWEDLGEPVPNLDIEQWRPEAAARTFLALHDRLVRDYGARP